MGQWAGRHTVFTAPAGSLQPRENSIHGDIRQEGASSEVTISELSPGTPGAEDTVLTGAGMIDRLGRG